MDSSHSNEETDGCHDSTFPSSESAQTLPCNNNAARVTPETIAQEFQNSEQDNGHIGTQIENSKSQMDSSRSHEHETEESYHDSSQREDQEHTEEVFNNRPGTPVRVTPEQEQQEFRLNDPQQSYRGPSLPNNDDDESHTGFTPTYKKFNFTDIPENPFITETDTALEADTERDEAFDASAKHIGEDYIKLTSQERNEVQKARSRESSKRHRENEKRKLAALPEADREAEIAKTKVKRKESDKRYVENKKRKLAALPEADREAEIAKTKAKRKESNKRHRENKKQKLAALPEADREAEIAKTKASGKRHRENEKRKLAALPEADREAEIAKTKAKNKESGKRHRAKKRQAKKQARNMNANDTDFVQREPILTDDQVQAIVDYIIACTPELHENNRDIYAIYISFTAQDPNTFSKSGILISRESYEFMRRKKWFRGYKRAGAPILFRLPNEEFGRSCRRTINGALTETDLHKRLLKKVYLEKYLGAEYKTLYECKSRENARNIEDAIQERLNNRKFGTEILWRAKDLGNRDPEEGDDTATFTVGMTVFDSELIKNLIWDDELVINKGKWDHDKKMYFDEDDNGERHYYL